MFGKVIVFGLLKMIQKKVRIMSPGPGWVGSGTTAWAVTFLVVSKSRFRRFYKMIFEIVCSMHCICI